MNFNNCTPQQKALFSVAVILLSAFLGAGVVALVIANGLFLYVGYAMILYGVFGMLRLVYRIQLDKFEREAEQKG